MRAEIVILAAAWIAGCGGAPVRNAAQLEAELRAAETAFAATMAARDFERFLSFVAEDAVFLNGGEPLRGKAAIAAHWQRHFQADQAPFSWAPELVQVLPSGRLGQTDGVVRAPDGTPILRFYSTWRREPSGRWLVVLDNGYAACPPAR